MRVWGPRLILWIDGLLFLAVGVWALITPYELMAAVGLTATGQGATTEIRAAYGGLSIGLCVPILAGAVSHAWRAHSLVVAMCAYGGFATGRFLGLLREGSWTGLQVQLLAVELTLWALSGLAWWALPAPTPPQSHATSDAA